MDIHVFARSYRGNMQGGMEIQVHDLLEQLTARGHTVTLYTTPPRDFFDTRYAVRHSPCGPPARYSAEFSRFTLEMVERLPMRRETLVFAVSAGAREIAFTLRRRGTPLVVQCHGTSLMESVSQLRTQHPEAIAKGAFFLSNVPRERRYFRLATLLVAVGSNVLDSLGSPAYASAVGSKVRLIPNGVDEEVFRFDSTARARIRHAHGLQPDTLVLLFAARLVRQKGWRDALRMFDVVRKHQEAKLLIVGDGPDRDALMLATRSDPDVVVLSDITREGIPAYMSAADALLFPTRRQEGLPMVILEAAASGLPVVAPLPILASTGVRVGVPITVSRHLERPALFEAVEATATRRSHLPSDNRLGCATDAYEEVLEEALRASYPSW